ncbi:hypothetical protein ACWDYH_02670 [Nocardia goodfellowii]
MSEGDFGRDNDNHEPEKDNDDDQEDDTMTNPEPLDPDDQPSPERAIEAPKQPTDSFEIETPSAGQLYAMFPDAIPKNRPDRRARHLTAVPNPNDLATLPDTANEDDLDDPLLARALRLRTAVVFWWRPASTAAVVVVIAVCAFFTVGAAIGIAWCIYGFGWTGHTVWQAHGRPGLRQLYRERRGGGW